jgi:hypothetical protein
MQWEDLLVCAPNSKVHLPFVQLALYIARSVGQIQTNQSSDLVRFLGKWGNIE